MSEFAKFQNCLNDILSCRNLWYHATFFLHNLGHCTKVQGTSFYGEILGENNCNFEFFSNCKNLGEWTVQSIITVPQKFRALSQVTTQNVNDAKVLLVSKYWLEPKSNKTLNFQNLQTDEYYSCLKSQLTH
jgi:hypothetical protein